MTELVKTAERSTEFLSSTGDSGQKVSQREYRESRRAPWYAAVLCRCGIYSGKWLYVTDGNCKQLKVCRHCGTAKVHIKHQREWRYIKNGACQQERTCKRCGEITRHRIRHVWGPAYSVDWSTSAHRCTRCGEIQTWVTTG